ncbi:unnamed protein product [Phytophthora lilii]|uniref:Unnamed protein product n=1 Tax=Phytophthora lilii TaxID=2077276 RepID=A0A9W6U2G0_9STRA|nr:unnamed protein product [Phytophthora lilii]
MQTLQDAPGPTRTLYLGSDTYEHHRYVADALEINVHVVHQEGLASATEERLGDDIIAVSDHVAAVGAAEGMHALHVAQLTREAEGLAHATAASGVKPGVLGLPQQRLVWVVSDIVVAVAGQLHPGRSTPGAAALQILDVLAAAADHHERRHVEPIDVAFFASIFSVGSTLTETKSKSQRVNSKM